MNNSLSTGDLLRTAIETTLLAEINRVREECIAKAQKDFDESIRKAVGNIAVNVSNYFSLQHVGDELVIRVQLDPRR